MPTFGWIKNPLSIIAIFISLIYGISGLLFGFSVSQLTPENQTVLVWFIVSFPVAVLLVFAWLVAKHHHKLYGPGDYRGDETFAQTFPTATTQEVSRKLGKEIEQKAPELSSIAERDEVAENIPPVSKAEAREDVEATFQFENKAELSFVLENLVVKEFQQEFKGAVRRDVKLRDDLIVDALLENSAEYVAAEIKVILGNARWYAFTAVQAGAKTLRAVQETLWRNALSKPVMIVLAVVVEQDFSEDQLNAVISRLGAEASPHLIIRTYRVPELLEKLPRPRTAHLT